MVKKRSLKGKGIAAARRRMAHARKAKKSHAYPRKTLALQARARKASRGLTMFGPIFSKKHAGKRAKGHVPLKILERRLAKLHRIVASRGGRV